MNRRQLLQIEKFRCILLASSMFSFYLEKIRRICCQVEHRQRHQEDKQTPHQVCSLDLVNAFERIVSNKHPDESDQQSMISTINSRRVTVGDLIEGVS